jgi:glucosamine-6-phosphate deaminase
MAVPIHVHASFGGPLSVDAIAAKYLRAGSAKIEVHPSPEAAGIAAAKAAAGVLTELAKTRDSIGVIFATGASQFDTLAALTRFADLPWSQIQGFHMDEYIGISANHPASFRHYLREKLTQKVRMKEFLEIFGDGPDPEETARAYAETLRAADPRLCLLGIGENGHLAFNDPDVADFADPLDAKVVQLDRMCREQQVAEGWFANIDEVPESAITLTVPALMRIPRLIASVPGPRKAKIVRRALEDSISSACPATILRTHPNVSIYLDHESASELDGVTFLSGT